MAYGFYNAPWDALGSEIQQQVRQFLTRVEAAWDIQLPEGRNPNVTFMRHLWEPLRSALAPSSPSRTLRRRGNSPVTLPVVRSADQTWFPILMVTAALCHMQTVIVSLDHLASGYHLFDPAAKSMACATWDASLALVEKHQPLGDRLTYTRRAFPRPLIMALIMELAPVVCRATMWHQVCPDLRALLLRMPVRPGASLLACAASSVVFLRHAAFSHTGHAV